MIKGMTGFGSAEFSNGKVKGTIEVKSLNHRFFDISFYLPSGFASIENKIRQVISKQISRGKVNVSIKIKQKPPATIIFNKEAIRKYLKNAKSLKKEFGLKRELSLSDLTRLPGVVEVKDSEVKAEHISSSLEAGVKKALKGLMVMRSREGRSLSVDLRDKLKKMLGQIRRIKQRSALVLRLKKKKLTEDEFLSFQKGSDVNEEITRLAHYIEEVRLLLNSNISVGKKMDFIAQEMQRETNTIGSKLQDKVVSNAVIALKSKIEKIREQSQNIE